MGCLSFRQSTPTSVFYVDAKQTFADVVVTLAAMTKPPLVFRWVSEWVGEWLGEWEIR